MRKYLLLFTVIYFAGCSSGGKLKKYYTPEDNTVFELVEKIRKNPNDKESVESLPAAYQAAVDKRKALNEANYATLPPGDRYMQLAKEYSVMQQMYDKINAVPAAKNAVPNLWDPSIEITKAKNNAAKEYYNQGLEYMTYDNRQAARSAYEYFNKANNVIPGYDNVTVLMQRAQERATVKVIVRAANYNNYSWNYWGFQNDWLQQQIINDLNAQSFRDVRFYSDWDANTRDVKADRIVELNFTELYIGQLFNNHRAISRSKEIQTGSTKSDPPTPIYKTVYATMRVNSRYMQSRAVLECRIYDQPTGNNILYDRFPGNDEWRIETATFTGDRQALTPGDLLMINNGSARPPSRTDVANRLVRNCYNLLLNRIKSGVQFGY